MDVRAAARSIGRFRANSLRAVRRQSTFVRHGAIVLAGLVVLNLGNYAFYGLVGRIAGVEAYGTITALFSALFLLMALSSIAATVIARLAADFSVADDVQRLKRLVDVVGWGTLVVGAAGGGAALILRFPLARFFALSDPGPIVAMSVALPFVLVLPVQRAVFQGSERYGPFAWSNGIEGVLKAIAGTFLAIPLGATGALYGITIASVGAWMYNLVAAQAAFGSKSTRLELPVSTIQSTTFFVAVTVVSLYGLLFYDVILVKHLFSARLAGLYSAAALVGRTIYFVLGFVPTIVLPKAASLFGSGQSQRALLLQAIGVAGAIIALALGVCCIAPRLVVTLLSGRAFADAAPYVPIYACAVGALAMANIITMSQIGCKSYSFVLPLALVTIGEITVVVVHHDSIAQVLLIVLFGHICALAACCFGLGQRPTNETAKS